MIIIDIDPIMGSIGPFTISWHGVFTMLAVVVGVAIAAYRARGGGFTRDDIYSLALWAVPGGIIGSRLFHVVENLDYYLPNPRAAFAFWEGGLGLWGAIIGGTLTAVLYARVRGLPVGRLADLIAPALPLAQAVGRIGCIINGDAYGTITTLPWGFVYTHPNAAATTRLWVPGHPAPAYEIVWDLIVFATVWLLRRRLPAAGMVYLVYLSVYAVGRFFISFLREELVIFGGLHQAHWIALLVLAIALPLLWHLYRQSKATRAAAPPARSTP